MINKVNISKLKENPENPRYINDSKFKKLVKSIKDFPEMLEARPLVVDENFMVLGGNMRLKALKSSGIFEVPIKQVFGWSDKKKREFIVKDNISYGEWDWDIIANNYDKEYLIDWGFEAYHFGSPTDFIDEIVDEQEDEEVVLHNENKVTDEGYVRFEIVLKEDDKKKLVKAINDLKNKANISSSMAFMKLLNI